MPTIDELLVTIALDPSKLATGRKQATEELDKLKSSVGSTSKGLGEHTEKMGWYFTMLRRQILQTIAAYVGFRALKEVMQQVVQTDLAIGNMAYSLDENVSSLSMWVNAAKLVNATAQDVYSSFGAVTSMIAEQKASGESGNLPWWRALEQAGVHLETVNNTLESRTKLMQELSAASQTMDGATFSLYASHIGVTPGMVSLLRRGPTELNRLLKEGKDAGVTSPESIAAAQKLTEAFALMELKAEAAGRSIMTNLTPRLISFFNAVGDGLTKFWAPHEGSLSALLQRLADVGGFGESWARGFDAKGVNSIPDSVPITGRVGGSKPVAKSGGGKGSYPEATNDIRALMSYGWTREQAIGIAANIDRESAGGNMFAQNKNVPTKKGLQTFRGLVQWDEGRQQDFAKRYGHDIMGSERWEQLDFINYEMRYGKERKAGLSLKATGTSSEAAEAIARDYERTDHIDKEVANRVNRALAIAGGGKGYGGKSSSTVIETNIGTINVNAGKDAGAPGAGKAIGNAIGPQLRNSIDPRLAESGAN